nr:hypothetical protein [Tanacetum cinerariifolium]
MKGPYPGRLLTAISVDPNNGIYPLAYRLVETENTESWTWFLTQHGDDLDLYRNSNFTFVSDRKKGIIPAIANLFLNAEHRYCVKHIHENMKKKWNGTTYKELLWRAAKSATVPDFQLAIEALKEFSNEAYKWLNLIPPQHLSRSHFSLRAKSDVLLNNMCEIFNGKLVAGRDRPIFDTLEFAREYIMKRCDGPLTPTAKILRSNSNEARKYTVDYAGDDLYQVSGPWNDQVVVNVLARTYTCRRWELTAIPFKNAVATNWVMSLNNEAGIPEEWVHPCYRLDAWKKVYSFKIKPIRGPRTVVLKIVKNGKLSREHKTVTCNKCNTKGHNSRSCNGPREPRSNKRKVPSKGMDDTNAPVGSQSKKKATTQIARSATSSDKGKAPTGSQSKDKGNSPITTTGVLKKIAPRKKIIKLAIFRPPNSDHAPTTTPHHHRSIRSCTPSSTNIVATPPSPPKTPTATATIAATLTSATTSRTSIFNRHHHRHGYGSRSSHHSRDHPTVVVITATTITLATTTTPPWLSHHATMPPSTATTSSRHQTQHHHLSPTTTSTA